MPTEIKHPVGVGDTAYVLHDHKIRRVRVMRMRVDRVMAHPTAKEVTDTVIFHSLLLDGLYRHHEVSTYANGIFESRDALIASL